MLSRWIAVFVLIVCIALIIVRWKFPRKQESSKHSKGFWREFVRTWKLSKKQKKERDLDIAALRAKSVLVIDPDEKSARILLWRLESIKASVTKEKNRH